MKKWHYEADAEWMRARNRFLTATDVVSLLPELKRVRKSGLKKSDDGEYSLACVGIWAEKNSSADIEVCAPSNDAARGHVLEPYAVEEFCKLTNRSLYHWDDMLISNDGNGLAFSPDALDIPQPIFGCGELPASTFTDETAPRSVLEIKSYSAKHHTQMLFESDGEHKERYQLAVAMCVVPEIIKAALMFYNPNAANPIIASVYTREDLEQEIVDVREIAEMWRITKETISKKKNWLPCIYNEDDIYETHVAESLDSMRINQHG